jgi:alpha-beta hydrolase superfamily lysophospholipase
MRREDVSFPSGDGRCAAWLYRPENAEPPCVILAHGFGGVREARLDAFAQRFCEAGYAALVFDYRHFGASTGEPRHLVDVERQLADWQAALGFARGLDDVDRDRMVLWGTSFSGGHVLQVAAHDRYLAAAIAQVPFVDGATALRALSLRQSLALGGAALLDVVADRLGRGPRYVPIVGPPGSAAAMSSHDAEPGYRSLFPDGYPLRNEVTARTLLQVGRYRPGRAASQITCPLLVCVVEHDAVTPAGPALRAASRAPRGEVRRYDAGHFDIYVGELFERAVADHVDFLRRHVALAGAARPPAPAPDGEPAPARAAERDAGVIGA